ncbi:MAG: DUF3341 domain-containing protein [Spirochaetia bacterium]|nr:DUF3341 domain-containing protein [Spirochaetia bacterium]
MVSFKEIKEGLFTFDEPDKGWVVEVKTAVDMLKAVEKVRKAGVKRFDTFSPFPVHGLEKAMGIKRSWLTLITMIAAFTGTTFALSAMSYIDLVDYPLNIGGKPSFAWPAYIPIMFELTILFASFATVIAVWKMGKLGIRYNHRRPVSPTVTCDMCSVWIGDDMTKEEVKKIVGDLAKEIHKVDATPTDNSLD